MYRPAKGGGMEDCIFCKMFTGEVPTRKVYEGGDVIAILDIAPLFGQGQCVVIHRRHVGQFYDLEDEEVARLFAGVKVVAGKIREAFGVPQVSIFSRGARISDHSHILVYPSTGEGPVDKMMAALVAALTLRATPQSELDAIAERIRKA
jgi:histidine triad (HIT) family protein